MCLFLSQSISSIDIYQTSCNHGPNQQSVWIMQAPSVSSVCINQSYCRVFVHTYSTRLNRHCIHTTAFTRRKLFVKFVEMFYHKLFLFFYWHSKLLFDMKLNKTKDTVNRVRVGIVTISLHISSCSILRMLVNDPYHLILPYYVNHKPSKRKSQAWTHHYEEHCSRYKNFRKCISCT